MTSIEFNWTTPDGVKIYGKEWKVEFPKAVIALVHGLGEHCNRYNHMAAYFAKHNISTVAYDRRGHGQSGGKRGHTPTYEALLEEVDQLIKETKNRYPISPIFIYGHSMGGNIALKYAISRNLKINGIITSGAFIEFPDAPPALLIAIGKIMRKIYPSFSQNNGLSPEDVSSDPAVVKAYIEDPLVHNKITSATGISMIEVAKELQNYKGSIRVPLLLMHGNADKLTGFEGSKNFANAVTGPVSYKEWDGAYHELHNESIQEEVFDYTINWIRERI
jgi:alpha-beta hydrolase superfamily lysophospholipase